MSRSVSATQSPIIETPGAILDTILPEIRARGATPDLPTGIPPLDNEVWGLKRRAVTVIAGRPSHGKSSVAGQIAWNLAEIGKRVVYLTLEMSREEITERFLCSFCEIDSDNMRKGKIPPDFEERVKTFTEVYKSLPIKIIPYGRHISQVKQIIEMFNRGENKIDVLFIDHIQRISWEGYSEKRPAMDDYLNDLEGLATAHNMAIVVLSQLSRQATSRKEAKPMMEDLKETGALEETGGTVLLLHWPGKDKLASDPAKWEYKIFVAKQRSGPVGMEIPLLYEAMYYRLKWTDENITKFVSPVKLDTKQLQEIQKTFGVEASLGTNNV